MCFHGRYITTVKKRIDLFLLSLIMESSRLLRVTQYVGILFDNEAISLTRSHISGFYLYGCFI